MGAAAAVVSAARAVVMLFHTAAAAAAAVVAGRCWWEDAVPRVACFTTPQYTGSTLMSLIASSNPLHAAGIRKLEMLPWVQQLQW
jgi:hypothetical protein